ncbi:hypothetical protein E3E31_07775 [Thermococcus sp. M39]|uniref:hypothetical protein n=1 Tax=unclassified Thermococcus TaxID=2627626 RepID=UPI0014389083|nr:MULTISPECIES: hypothetical protein [unclassified Thermococcus]NJE08421.1 hypothetical protein [Thermococcus sp. M39]NJE11923.1 hypothetical protein [Thermococcus sp. LS2]
MGYFAEMLKREFEELDVKDIYTTKLGSRDIEILEVSACDTKFLAMFQSEEKKHGLYLWSLIITSANNTRTIRGIDRLETLKMRIKENVRAIVEGMKED